MVTEEDINKAYATLCTRKSELYRAREAEAAALQTLKSAKYSGILSGKIYGKNETEQEAVAEALLTAEIADTYGQERWRRQAQHDYELALLEVERLQLLSTARWMVALGFDSPVSRQAVE